MVKELLITALAVAIGFLVASAIKSKFPKVFSWESSYESLEE